MARKIKMLKMFMGSPDHVSAYPYHQDVVYEIGSNNPEPLPDDALDGAQAAIHPMNDHLADIFVRDGVAEEASSIRAKSPGPAETK